MLNESAMRYVNRLKEYWNKFSKTQKMVFLATIILLVLTVGLVSYNLSKTEYAQAFTDLQPNDAAAIKQYLDASKIPYKLSDDGKSIGVPRSQVANVKLDVESQGLNKSGNIGYGAFRETNMFGTTDNEFSIKKLDMIQGELQQLINSNQAVSGSKVIITLPEESVFLKKDGSQQSTASVVIQLKPGYSLDQNKIDTMYQLVSKSVKSLPIENITISDQNGDLLPYSKGAGSTITSATAASMQFEIKKQFEQDLRKNIKELLGGILGPNKVMPMVVATMNFDKKSTVENLVTPVNTVDQKGIEISVNEIQKSYTSDGAAAGGVAGTGTTDIPNYPSSSQSGKSNSEETQKTVNYEVNRITNQIESSPFSLTDLTISVGIEPPDPKNIESLSQQTKDSIQKLLVSVVSSSLANSGKTFTPEQLDAKVNVFTSSFANSQQPAQAAQINWVLYGGLGLAALALAGLGGFLISRRKKAKEAEEEVLAAPKMEYPSIDLEHATNDNQVRKQLETLAKKKPEEFVNLLRTWLVDE
ncbi:flagellar M-ring protein [Paenibacillus sp. J31TS4]|uniref:flagellar basal-body MS-ring/collar protein FliF n=1 Tax=Paenibacillus sp. J31TS4 TaxID=2807195 RepID=UPI001B1FF0E6|nr:flagellar basal-body MS-ring/collar protein FliF [Paenibacillus sp. J31TS4]GIP36808.1 flagellar M-ring protein [Paenibacillus sp. J31TS4]